MEKMIESQDVCIGKRKKIKMAFIIAAFLAIVVNAFYFYELYMLDGEKTVLLKSIEVFNVVLSFYIYSLIVRYYRSMVFDLSGFLNSVELPSKREIDGKEKPKPFMFIKQWRMYPSLKELIHDLDKLKRYNSGHSYWLTLSLGMLFLCLLVNSIEILFCGESARVFMVWRDDVAFYLFFIPKCIFALLFVFNLCVLLYYRYKLKTLINDTSKCNVNMLDISDSL